MERLLIYIPVTKFSLSTCRLQQDTISLFNICSVHVPKVSSLQQLFLRKLDHTKITVPLMSKGILNNKHLFKHYINEHFFMIKF